MQQLFNTTIITTKQGRKFKLQGHAIRRAMRDREITAEMIKEVLENGSKDKGKTKGTAKRTLGDIYVVFNTDYKIVTVAYLYGTKKYKRYQCNNNNERKY